MWMDVSWLAFSRAQTTCVNVSTLLAISNVNVKHPDVTLWRNGSASDSRSEGCVFKSRQGHLIFNFVLVKVNVVAVPHKFQEHLIALIF